MARENNQNGRLRSTAPAWSRRAGRSARGVTVFSGRRRSCSRVRPAKRAAATAQVVGKETEVRARPRRGPSRMPVWWKTLKSAKASTRRSGPASAAR